MKRIRLTLTTSLGVFSGYLVSEDGSTSFEQPDEVIDALQQVGASSLKDLGLKTDSGSLLVPQEVITRSVIHIKTEDLE